MNQGRMNHSSEEDLLEQENLDLEFESAVDLNDDDAWLKIMEEFSQPETPAQPQTPRQPQRQMPRQPMPGQLPPNARREPRPQPRNQGMPGQASRNSMPAQGNPGMRRDPRQLPPQGAQRMPGQMPQGQRPAQGNPNMRRDPRQMPPQGGQGVPPMQRPPMPPHMEPQPMPEQPRKKSHTGGLVFYTIFFAGILAFYVFAYGLLGSLQDWLVSYESAQPTQKCQEVFDQYFADPDWGKLYDLAGIQQTTFEGKDAFVTYMDQRVGDQELTYLETSAGLSNDKKYIVRLGDEKIASFTLTDKNQAQEITDIPAWELDEIQLFYQGVGTYEIQILAGYHVKVNGVPLGEDAVVRVATTHAGEYLPEGVMVPAMNTLEVSGLMTVPTVEITDANGTQVDVSYDEQTHTFSMSMEVAQDGVSEEEKQLALEAIKTYAIYMSQKGGGDEELSRYFERGTDLYKTLSSMERMWNQSYSSSKLTDESVTDAVRYSDDLFSARVSVNLHLVRGDGTEKVTEIDRSMFFKRVADTWKCYDMTAVDINEPVEKVRLTFRTEEEVLQSELVDAGSAQVQCPVVTAPEGKTFSGWTMETFKENGDRVLRLVMVPDENGLAAAPAGMGPMTLYPLFEDANS